MAGSTSIAPKGVQASLVIVMALVLIGETNAGESTICPILKDAVHSWPDFNSPELGIHWFTQRGLQRDRRYGCSKRQYKPGQEPIFNFALDCKCEAWEQCGARPMEFTFNFERSTSLMGECKCCAWWVILLICIGCLCVVILVINLPRIKRAVERWWKRRNHEALDANAPGGKYARGLQRMEEGEMDDLATLGPLDKDLRRPPSRTRVRRRRTPPSSEGGPRSPSLSATAGSLTPPPDMMTPRAGADTVAFPTADDTDAR